MLKRLRRLAIARSCLLRGLRPCQAWVSDVTDVKGTGCVKQEDRENGGKHGERCKTKRRHSDEYRDV